jgi:ubiquinone biosynthesis accessory factor UbiK
MIDRRLLDELGERLGEATRNSPAADLEKNLRALLGAFFDRFDVVLREDFEVQRRLLERAQAKLADLEARLAQLEQRR